MKSVFSVFAASVALFILAACSGSAQSDILGTWYEVGGTDQMQFFEDGTIQIIHGSPTAGKYSFPDSEHIRLEMGGGIAALAGPVVFGLEVDDDLLVIINIDGERSSYTRERNNDVAREIEEKQREALLGFWKYDGVDAGYVFAADGTVANFRQFEGQEETYNNLAEFRHAGDNIIVISYSQDGKTRDTEWGYKLAGDSLSLWQAKYEQRTKTKMTRLDRSVPKTKDAFRPTVGDQVRESLNLGGGAKTAVAEFFQDQGRFPRDNKEAGLSPPFNITGKYVVSVAVTSNGVIKVTYGGEADPKLHGMSIYLVANANQGSITWRCYGDRSIASHLPPACETPVPASVDTGD